MRVERRRDADACGACREGDRRPGRERGRTHRWPTKEGGTRGARGPEGPQCDLIRRRCARHGTGIGLERRDERCGPCWVVTTAHSSRERRREGSSLVTPSPPSLVAASQACLTSPKNRRAFRCLGGPSVTRASSICRGIALTVAPSARAGTARHPMPLGGTGARGPKPKGGADGVGGVGRGRRWALPPLGAGQLGGEVAAECVRRPRRAPPRRRGGARAHRAPRRRNAVRASAVIPSRVSRFASSRRGAARGRGHLPGAARHRGGVGDTIP